MAIKRILLIDSSAVLHAVKFGGPKKLKTKEKSTFVIFGFLMKLRFLMNKTYADVVVFAGDTKRQDSLRKKKYSSYKEGREANKTSEQIELDKIAMPQFGEVLDIVLPMLGYKNIFKFKGYEADDVIGVICKKYKKLDIIIVTSDKDMYQLLTDNVAMLHPTTHQFFTKKDFIAKYGIKPKMWKKVKSIGGCSSDAVKGVKIPMGPKSKKQMHVAEKGALNYVLGETNPTSKAHMAIESEEGQKQIKRNKKLVVLPFKGTPDCEIVKDELTKHKIKKVAKTYGFKSIKSDINNWVRVLRSW